MNRLPVTLVGGFFGAGKTSLLHHIISEHRGGHLAILVENPGTLNFDAKALRGLCGAMRRLQDTVLEIPAGDTTVQARWLSIRLREFFEAGRYERVLIELPGTTNASWVKRYFALAPGRSDAFCPGVELEQSICVVDALDWVRQEKTAASTISFSDLVGEQIADASLVVFNKCDLIKDFEGQEGLKSIRSINSKARVVQTAYGEVPAEIWSARDQPQELEGSLDRGQREATRPMQAELASILYRVHRPFHSGRFWEWFNADHAGLLRVKGLIWLATRNFLVGGVSRTRSQNGCGAAGIWWAALPREEWPEDPEALGKMQEIWREPYGDRRQELVLIGEANLLPTLRRQLEACLLTDVEYALPLNDWARFLDPFPAWDLEAG